MHPTSRWRMRPLHRHRGYHRQHPDGYRRGNTLDLVQVARMHLEHRRLHPTPTSKMLADVRYRGNVPGIFRKRPAPRHLCCLYSIGGLYPLLQRQSFSEAGLILRRRRARGCGGPGRTGRFNKGTTAAYRRPRTTYMMSSTGARRSNSRRTSLRRT